MLCGKDFQYHIWELHRFSQYSLQLTFYYFFFLFPFGDSKETGNELFTHGIVGLFSLTHHLPPHNSMRRKVRSQSSFAFCEEDTTDIFYPRWFTNPFTRGSFTYFPLGTTSEDITNLAMNLENLYFAGEGTSVDWCGYMQGAYLTGQEKARRISSVIKQRETESWTSRCG